MTERARIGDIQKPIASSNGGGDTQHLHDEHVVDQVLRSGSTTTPAPHRGRQVFTAAWDDEGVYFYQAYKDEIADWAITHQSFANCPAFDPNRMTWLKPSFAWVLYRSGYGTKPGQERVLKIKVTHDGLGRLLSGCVCGHGLGGTKGRIQWDPERDIMGPSDAALLPRKRRRKRAIGSIEPRKMVGQRAIQIGVARDLSEQYIKSIIRIEDVTQLAHRVRDAHQVLTMDPNSDAMQTLLVEQHVPTERPYVPHVDPDVLVQIGLASAESGTCTQGNPLAEEGEKRLGSA